jgi:hypothetical protein
MEIAVVVWFERSHLANLPSAEDIKRTIGMVDATEANALVQYLDGHAIEDQEGEIWEMVNSRLDLGSAIPHLDIFVETWPAVKESK